MSKKIISFFVITALGGTLLLTPETRRDPAAAPSGAIVSAADEAAPTFLEVGQTATVQKKARRFPWAIVLGVAAAAGIGIVLALTVFKEREYDIRGTWEVDLYIQDQPRRVLTLVFRGDDRAKGDYVGDGYGVYAVEGRKVGFGYFTHATGWHYNGEFTARDRMSGAYGWASAWSPSRTGTWFARKVSSSTDPPGSR